MNEVAHLFEGLAHLFRGRFGLGIVFPGAGERGSGQEKKNEEK